MKIESIRLPQYRTRRLGMKTWNKLKMGKYLN